MAVPSNPATKFLAITPSDTQDAAHDLQRLRIRGIIVNGAGNVALQGIGDVAAVTIAVAANVVYPFAPQYILATAASGNTTATGIIGLI